MESLPDNIKELLDIKWDYYNNVAFIENDPISVPHMFTRSEDIEIAGFLAATLSWGQRKTIISKARILMQLMDYTPYEFVLNCTETDFQVFDSFKHRTFNATDCKFFIRSLKNIYLNYGSLEMAFSLAGSDSIKHSIEKFRDLFFSIPYPERTKKHISDPAAGSPAKRINMFLRWMVRQDGRGVDFGIWKSISPASLYCPLDTHTGNVARKLGLLTRKQNDWKALEQLMIHLRAFDPEDPVKYDFALFGLGIFEKF